MTPEFYYLLNVILVSRLLFLPGDTPVPLKAATLMTLLQIAGLLILQFDYGLWVLFILLAAFNFGFSLLERKWQNLDVVRLSSLLVNIILASIFLSQWIGLEFSYDRIAFLQQLRNYSVLLDWSEKANFSAINVQVMGFLLVINEVNYIIRYQLRVSKILPHPSASDPESKPNRVSEYRTGKVIGVLERVIIYFLILNNEIAAIGFVLAAKGLLRFKELEKREFSEFVLIGTLLSALLALLVGSMIKGLLE